MLSLDRDSDRGVVRWISRDDFASVGGWPVAQMRLDINALAMLLLATQMSR
ncbi:hypothetical protein LC55x_3154 [Lysobacter capsici]|nr:hypothetical protein LC55x_3154 [Lysobacter capsici]